MSLIHKVPRERDFVSYGVLLSFCFSFWSARFGTDSFALGLHTSGSSLSLSLKVNHHATIIKATRKTHVMWAV